MNDFQIITKLGEGAYSTVYKVKRLIDGNIYALKKVKLLNLSDKEKENALNEVPLLASVKSNFVISYKEAFFDEKDSTLGIVMEFADRGDLYQKIVEHKKSAVLFEESDIWRIFIQLVKGLRSLHELKILHRDLKSANVFLLSNGSAKLGDLNVSKVARRGLGYTQTGTPYYASPEVWKDKPYDHKSDIWSLGCVLYEMITLKPPFRAQNMEGLYNKVIRGQFNKIPERYSNDLFQIVQLLIQVNPESRPNCEEIIAHPIIQKRIEYFKSFSGDDSNEDNCLLKTIRIPKNLLFLSDKLPKPNYDKMKNSSMEIKQMNNKNYRSFNVKRDQSPMPNQNGNNGNNMNNMNNKNMNSNNMNSNNSSMINNNSNCSNNNNNNNNNNINNNNNNNKIPSIKETRNLVPITNKVEINLDPSHMPSKRKETSLPPVLMKKPMRGVEGSPQKNNSRLNSGNRSSSIENKPLNIVVLNNSINNNMNNNNNNNNNNINMNSGKGNKQGSMILMPKKKIDLSKIIYNNNYRKINPVSLSNNNNPVLNDIYKIYAPYINKQGMNKYYNNNNKMRMEKKYYMGNGYHNYANNLEKYYNRVNKMDYGYGGGMKINGSSSSIDNMMIRRREYKIVPKRRLSPVKKNVASVC